MLIIIMCHTWVFTIKQKYIHCWYWQCIVCYCFNVLYITVCYYEWFEIWCTHMFYLNAFFNLFYGTFTCQTAFPLYWHIQSNSPSSFLLCAYHQGNTTVCFWRHSLVFAECHPQSLEQKESVPLSVKLESCHTMVLPSHE